MTTMNDGVEWSKW